MLFQSHFFENLKPTGKSELYHQLKKVYRTEKYLDFQMDSALRRNITSIRVSAHCLPIELLRRRGVERNMRLCNMCPDREIGTEIHVMSYCQNRDMLQLRKQLRDNISKYQSQICIMSDECLIRYLLLATDPVTCFYFAVFLKKMFGVVRSNYQKC